MVLCYVTRSGVSVPGDVGLLGARSLLPVILVAPVCVVARFYS